jgi:arabinogalactan endo-1,4-beta-galactosidase
MKDAAAFRNAFSDSSAPSHSASCVTDGRPDTFWEACDGNPGHWWKVDLGRRYYILHIVIRWREGPPYSYVLELSLDGENWITASEDIERTAASHTTRDPVNAAARFVKIIVTGGVSEERRAGFYVFQVLTGSAPPFIKGADVSHLPQIEDFGGRFFDRKGREKGCLDILREHGVNFIRLKIWNRPAPPNSDPAGYNDKAHVLRMAKRVKDHGFGLLLDFHYSDWWADPGKQLIPKDWESLGFEQLNAALSDFTSDVVSSLKARRASPDMVQVGNEITNGMLWDVARVSGEFDTAGQWDNLRTLLKSGLHAVKAVDSSIRTVIHTDRGGDNAASVRFYDRLADRGVEFDIIGLSYYSIWHGPVSAFRDNVNDLARRYGKQILVVETAFPYTEENGDDTPNATSLPYGSMPPGYPATIKGQADNLQAVISVLKKIPDKRGMGFFYWQPDFIPVKGAGWKYGAGSEWDDQTMFDFTGHALWSLDVFGMH